MSNELQVFRGDCPMPSARHPHVVVDRGVRMACIAGGGDSAAGWERLCSNPHPHASHACFFDEEAGVRRAWCAGWSTAAHNALLIATGAGHPEAAARLPQTGPWPPDRPAVCAHDVRGPLRQACCCCGVCDHIDFRVPDEIWAVVVPLGLAGGHVCLRCFDAMAAERQVNYGAALSEVCFVGDAATVGFTVATVVNAPY